MGDMIQKVMSVFTKIALAKKRQEEGIKIKQFNSWKEEQKQAVIKQEEKKTMTQRCGIWTVLWIAFISITIGATWMYTYEHSNLIFESEKIIYERVGVNDSEKKLVSVKADADTHDSLSGTEGNTLPSASEIDDKICKAFPEDCETMIAISKAENEKRDQFAVGYNKDGSIDVGIFQINSVHGYDKEWLFDIDNNIEAAKYVYNTQGKEAWVTYNTNKHLSHL